MALLLNRLPANAVTGVVTSAPAITKYSCAVGQLAVPELPPSFVVAASYLWNVDWFAEQLGDTFMSSTGGGLIIGHHVASSPSYDDDFRSFVVTRFGTSFSYAAPSNMSAFGTQHAKFIIIVYPRLLRIAISSNNFVPLDFERKTGSIFVQSFPLARASGGSAALSGDANSASATQDTDFGTALRAFLQKMQEGSGQAAAPAFNVLLEHLQRFDYSGARADLVASIPGAMEGATAMAKYGHTRIASLLRGGLGPEDTPQRVGDVLLAQYSSTGSPYLPLGTRAQPTPPLLEQLSRSFSTLRARHRGGAGARAGETATSASASSPSTTSQGPQQGGVKRPRNFLATADLPEQLPWQLVWPSANHIRRSTEGWSGGVSVPGDVAHQQRAIRRLWHLYEGAMGAGRDRSVPHCKFFLRYVPPPAALPTPPTAAVVAGGQRPTAAAAVVESGHGLPAAAQRGNHHQDDDDATIIVDDSDDEGGACDDVVVISTNPASSASSSPSLVDIDPAFGATAPQLLVVATGSHNLSGSAWGTVNQPTKPPPKTTMLAYELGVLLTPRRWTASLLVEAAQVAEDRFPSEAWEGVGGMVVPPAAVAVAWHLPRAEVVFRALPWDALGPRHPLPPDHVGGETVVWLPLPFRLPPRPYSPSDIGWSKQRCASHIRATDGASIPGKRFAGLDGYGLTAESAEHNPCSRPQRVAKDPGPLSADS